MTIIDELASRDVRGIAVGLPDWAEQLGEHKFRGKCECSWVGPGVPHLSSAYVDWELHQNRAHSPEVTSCPEWCDDPKEHPWTVDGIGSWRRCHRLQSAEHTSLCAIETRGVDGMCALGPLMIDIDTPDGDLSLPSLRAARALVAELVEAAEVAERIAGSAE